MASINYLLIYQYLFPLKRPKPQWPNEENGYHGSKAWCGVKVHWFWISGSDYIQDKAWLFYNKDFKKVMAII